jgi:long-chain acyl-CoA synthetase
MSDPNVPDDIVAKLAEARSLPGMSSEAYAPPFASIGALFKARAMETPSKNWLTYYGADGRAVSYTYAQFYDLVLRVASLLRDLGIRPGDRIATLMGNDPRTVAIYFGAWAAGVTVAPVNCGEDDERVEFILQNAEAHVVFAMEEQTTRIERIRESLVQLVACVQVGGTALPNWISLEDRLEHQDIYALPDIKDSQECLIVYTSGTTGAPKGVVLEQRNLLADALSISRWHRFCANDRAMCVLPIHHVNGITVTLMTPLLSGGSVVLNHRFSAHTFWQVLADEQCTWVSVVPTVLAFLCERHEDIRQRDLSRFRHIICGAGPLTVELARRFDEQFGVRVVHGYGLSETTCYSCFLPIDLDPAAYRHWMMECGFPSIGCPIDANEMAIHDAEGHVLPPDTRGEIVVRGFNVMKYYFKRPEANRETFAHGWFRSGDEGFFRRGEDGRDYYFITGRIKELIIRGGVNYSPFDIDEVLNAVPGVRAAMAVGFDNSFYGEEIGAYVQRAEGSEVSEEEILRFCRARLPFSKSPKVVLFGDSFPVTSTGKYQRNRLKGLFAAWKETQFREGRGQ